MMDKKLTQSGNFGYKEFEAALEFLMK